MGMTDAQMDRCRKRLEQFLVDLLEPIGRSERRHWGSVYVRGLLLDGERKSVEPMAKRPPDGNEQAMQQFVGQSPWEWQPVWGRLARRMVKELEPDAVWVIDDTGFPKQGGHSVGVARQYSGTLGKTANCQVAVSLHEVCTEGAAVLSWRLYLPESWANDPQRLAEAGVPKEVTFRKKWELALEMIDQAREWELTDRIIVADAGYGDVTAFREELEKRKLRYAVGVQSNTGVWVEPPHPRKLKPKGTGRPPSASHYGKQRPVAVKEAAQGFHEGREPGKAIWLLIEWPEKTAEPTRYFFCDLPAEYSLRRLVQVAKARWKIEQDYQQLKEELGLDHYEGRSWSGWHHHVTLVMLAHSFLTLETLRHKKNFWVDPAEDAS